MKNDLVGSLTSEFDGLFLKQLIVKLIISNVQLNEYPIQLEFSIKEFI